MHARCAKLPHPLIMINVRIKLSILTLSLPLPPLLHNSFKMLSNPKASAARNPDMICFGSSYSYNSFDG